MKRRNFIHNSVLSVGGIIIGKSFLFADALKEVNQQFVNEKVIKTYDLIINGGGIAGYYTAIEAARKGLSVLLLDKRTSLAYDIAAKRKLWIQSEGYNKMQRAHLDLLFPDAERSEIEADITWVGNFNSSGEEMLLFAGSVKKGFLRNLLVNKVNVMLMTDVCGIITCKNSVNGVLVATKQGVYTIRCKSFIDATENNLFSVRLFNQEFEIEKASFVVELNNVLEAVTKSVRIDRTFGVLNDTLYLHQGKRSKHQQLIEFEFQEKTNNKNRFEQRARTIASSLGKELAKFDPSLQKAKIYNYALECSYFLDKKELPKTSYRGYYYIENPTQNQISCTYILDLEKQAKSLINRLDLSKEENGDKTITLFGLNVLKNIQLGSENLIENGLELPLFPFDTGKISHMAIEKCQVLIGGGGTAGSAAAISSMENGADTLVVDYFNDLGGTKTMGGVRGYYNGLRDNSFNIQLEKELQGITNENNLAGGTERGYYFQKAIKDGGCRIIGGAITCGVRCKDNKVNGIIVCEDGELFTILADIVVDGTGDADIAAFAGVNFTKGGKRTGLTQNYSQWDIKEGWSLNASFTKDYDIIDNTMVSELQRGLFLSHYEASFYDFYPMLTVRESRLPEGLYQINLNDVINNSHFDDIIARSKSDFDPHYVGDSDYTRCGFLLPHSNLSITEIPYRAIIPKSIDGLLFSGRGISQTNEAMQFTRMSLDVCALGYVTGKIAAKLAIDSINPRDFDIQTIQEECINQQLLPKKNDEAFENVLSRIEKLKKGDENYLFKCCLAEREEILPILISEYDKQSNINIAKALCWFSSPTGVSEVVEETEKLFQIELQDSKNRIRFDKYDSKSIYWRINQNISLLAKSGDKRSINVILHILKNTSSGGSIPERENNYENNRIDLRLVPFHNRIFSLCYFIEHLPDPVFSDDLERLVDDQHIKGKKSLEYDQTRWNVYGADLELRIASALARCQSVKGYHLLIDYLNDVHSNFRGFANSELRRLTKKDFGYDLISWKLYIGSLKI